MKAYDTAQIRNVALVGHGATGKTTLAESILFLTGATTRRGRPADGTSGIDASPEEVRRKISISLGLAPIEWEGHKINFIDAPGCADFIGEAEAAVHVTDLALILVNAGAGVESDTERFFELAHAAGKPVCFVVNQMDREAADFDAVLQQLRANISDHVVPFTLPIGKAADFKGLVDVVTGKAYVDAGNGRTQAADVPGAIQGRVDELRQKLTEAAAETDDTLMEKYFEQGSLSPDEMVPALRAGVHRGTVHPVVVLSGETLVGLDRLLDFVLRWGPSPLEGRAPQALREGQAEATPLEGRLDGPPVALLFKTYFDERLGEYSLLRVYSGRLAPGDYYDTRKQTTVRVGALYTLRGRERLELEALVCGDIGAVARLRAASTNDTLCAKENRVTLDPIAFSEPLHTVAVGPATRGEEEKVAGGFARLQEYDPTFQMRVDSALHQMLISGMGDQHLDVQLERLRTRNKVEAVTRKPRIPYRETIQRTVDDIQGRYKKQTGGRGQYGDVHLKIEPLPRGGGFEFVDAIVGGVVPSKFIPAVEKGIRETMERGVLVGYPVVDVRATLHFGSYHDVDSSEQAFKMAAWMAFRDGFLQCSPVLLEPIMRLEISVPDEYTGDIMGDISSRRGRIQGMERHGKRQRVIAEAPLGEVYGYVAALRSMTQGRGRFRMEMSRYEEVPREVQERLVETLRKEMDEAKA